MRIFKILLLLICLGGFVYDAYPQKGVATKVVKKVSKSAAHDAEKRIAEKMAAKGFKRTSMNFADRAVGEQFIKKAAREKVCELMEKQGLKSFLSYGNHMAAKEIRRTGMSASKRTMLSLSRKNGYRARMMGYRKEARQKAVTETKNNVATKNATKTVVKRTLKGKVALELLYKKHPEMRQVIKELNKRFPWKDNYMVEELSDGSLIVTSLDNSITKMKIKGNVISLEPGSTTKEGAMNQFANVILPNKTYNIGNGCFVYKTDKYGRVVDAYGDRTKALGLPERGGRNSDVQNAVINDGIKGKDDGGHLFAKEHNGPNEKLNQVPMNGKFNRNGEWRKLEEEETKYIKSGKQVNSRRQLMYKGASKRPYAIKVWLYVDKKLLLGFPKILKNPA